MNDQMQVAAVINALALYTHESHGLIPAMVYLKQHGFSSDEAIEVFATFDATRVHLTRGGKLD